MFLGGTEHPLHPWSHVLCRTSLPAPSREDLTFYSKSGDFSKLKQRKASASPGSASERAELAKSLLCSRVAGPNPAVPDGRRSCSLPPCPFCWCPLSAPQVRGVLAPVSGIGELVGRWHWAQPWGRASCPDTALGPSLEPALPQHTQPLAKVWLSSPPCNTRVLLGAVGSGEEPASHLEEALLMGGCNTQHSHSHPSAPQADT